MTWTLSQSSSKTPVVAGTATMTIASPTVITFTQNLSTNDQVYFTTTGALPTGITAGQKYFVIATSLSTSSFEISTSAGGSAVNTSGSQSGTHTIHPVQMLGTNDINNATFVFEADCTNLVNGDQVSFYIYTVTLSGGLSNVAWKGSFANAQVASHKISPPIASDQQINVYILQDAGTARVFPWKLLRI